MTSPCEGAGAYHTDGRRHARAAIDWRHLSVEAYRHRIADLVHEIEAERDRQQGGREPLGAEGVKAQNPLEAPATSKKSPAPDFHAATKSVLQALRDDYREFVAEYREASAKYLAGDRLAQFPAGSFPPDPTSSRAARHPEPAMGHGIRMMGATQLSQRGPGDPPVSG